MTEEREGAERRMRLIPNLLPFGQDACKACGTPTYVREPALRYCEGLCVEDGQGGFASLTTAGDGPAPHLHVTCDRCSYQWLTKTRPEPPK
jgi:hypothetical protein